MAGTKKRATKPPEDPDELRSGWLAQLSELIDHVEGWSKGLDWSTRRIEKKMEDPLIGTYKAPALMLQKETVRVLMEPIARSTVGGGGLVDLYRMPAYDDIASLHFYDGSWKVHYASPGDPVVGDVLQAEARPLDEESLLAVLEKMVDNAA